MKNRDISQAFRFYLAARLNTYKEQDDFVLSDTLLIKVLNHEVQLNKKQKKLLMQSPQTLRHFRQLFIQKQEQLRHLLNWNGSDMMLRAAAGDGAFSIDSEDELFTLHFIPVADSDHTFEMILSCENDLAAKLREHQITIKVKDRQGRILLKGKIDEENEIYGTWSLATSPREYFLETGAGIRIEIG